MRRRPSRAPTRCPTVLTHLLRPLHVRRKKRQVEAAGRAADKEAAALAEAANSLRADYVDVVVDERRKSTEVTATLDEALVAGRAPVRAVASVKELP